MTHTPATYGRPYPRRVAAAQRFFTNLHTAAYRLSGGRLGETLLGMPMLLLSTWGRKTGLLRTAPLLYLPIDGRFVLVASNGGAKQHPTWWFNLQANPEALVQIGPERGRVRAEAVAADERARYWPLLLDIYPQYANYQARTNREIPLLALRPIDHNLFRGVPRRYRAEMAS